MPTPSVVEPRRIAIVGAGPVGLTLALRLARERSVAGVSLFDARLVDADVGADPRTIALSLGSTRLLERVEAWQPEWAQTISEIHISQTPELRACIGAGPTGLRIRAADEDVPFLGAVLPYGRIVAPLQQAWHTVSAAESDRLESRFGTTVVGLVHRAGGVDIRLQDGTAQAFDLAVVAEGGIFAHQTRKAVRHDYGQAAWVGTVALAPGARQDAACERFTRHGPLALLPLQKGRAALVWCVSNADDPVAPLHDAQRLTVLNSLLPPEFAGVTAISSLKRFPLGLNAERTVVDRRVVRIGNAAQTLHPVAGQGLNLGLRDAWVLAEGLKRCPDIDAVLRRLEWERAPDRWSMIAATDFLARSFAWQLPGAATARSLGLTALNAFGPLKSALARHMMYGAR